MPLKFPLIDLSGVKGILIDLDNTLYDFSEMNRRASRKAHKHIRKYIDFESFFSQYTSLLKKNMEKGRPSDHSRFQIFRQMLEERNVPQAWALAEKTESSFWDYFIGHIRPDKEALAFLKKAKENNIPVCLVSDMFGNIQAKKLQKMKLEKYIDFIVTNDEVFCDKPHPEIFRKALEKLKIQPEKAIMVGDNPIKDIQGAAAASIKGYLVEVLPNKN